MNFYFNNKIKYKFKNNRLKHKYSLVNKHKYLFLKKKIKKISFRFLKSKLNFKKLPVTTFSVEPKRLSKSFLFKLNKKINFLYFHKNKIFPLFLIKKKVRHIKLVKVLKYLNRKTRKTEKSMKKSLRNIKRLFSLTLNKNIKNKKYLYLQNIKKFKEFKELSLQGKKFKKLINLIRFEKISKWKKKDFKEIKKILSILRKLPHIHSYRIVKKKIKIVFSFFKLENLISEKKKFKFFMRKPFKYRSKWHENFYRRAHSKLSKRIVKFIFLRKSIKILKKNNNIIILKKNNNLNALSKKLKMRIKKKKSLNVLKKKKIKKNFSLLTSILIKSFISYRSFFKKKFFFKFLNKNKKKKFVFKKNRSYRVFLFKNKFFKYKSLNTFFNKIKYKNFLNKYNFKYNLYIKNEYSKNNSSMIFFLKKFQSLKKNIFNILNVDETTDSHTLSFNKKKSYYNYLNYFSFIKNKSFYFFKKQFKFDFFFYPFNGFDFINISRLYLSFFFFNLYISSSYTFERKFEKLFFLSSGLHICFFNFLTFSNKIKVADSMVKSLVTCKKINKVKYNTRSLLLSNIFFFPSFKELSDFSDLNYFKIKKKYADFFTYFKIYSFKNNSNFDHFQEILPVSDTFLTPNFYSQKKFIYFKNFNKLNFFYFLKNKKNYLTIKNLDLFTKDTEDEDSESSEDSKDIDRKDKKINKLFLNFLNLFYLKNINYFFFFKKKNNKKFFLFFFKDFYLKKKLKNLTLSPVTSSNDNNYNFYLNNKNTSIFSYKNKNILKKFNLFSFFNYDLFFFFHKPIFLKTFIFKNLGSNSDSSYISNCFSFIKKFPLSSKFNNILTDNLLSFDIIRQALHSFSTGRIQSYYSYLPHIALLNFLEYCTGRKVLIKVDPFVLKSISEEDKYRCFMWSRRLRSFRKNLGPRLFLNESLQIITLCLRLKDPYVLSDWMLSMFYKISFWKYKMLFRYMLYILRNFFWSYFPDYGVKGLKFQLKGKVSVAGNGRKRTVVMRVGALSHGTYKYKVLTHLNLLRTFTGVIGFRTWFVF